MSVVVVRAWRGVGATTTEEEEEEEEEEGGGGGDGGMGTPSVRNNITEGRSFNRS